MYFEFEMRQNKDCFKDSDSRHSDTGLFDFTTAPSLYILAVVCTLGN